MVPDLQLFSLDDGYRSSSRRCVTSQSISQRTVLCGVPLFFAGGVDGASLSPRFLYPFPTLGTAAIVAFSWHLSRDMISACFCQEGIVQKLPLTLCRLPSVNHHGCCAGVCGGSASGCLVEFVFLVYNSLFVEGIALPSRLLCGSRIGNFWTICFMSCSLR